MNYFLDEIESAWPLRAEPNHVFVLGDEFDVSGPSPCFLAAKTLNADPKMSYVQIRAKRLENKTFSQANVVWEGFNNCPDEEYNNVRCYVTEKYEEPLWNWEHKMARVPILYLDNFPPILN